MTKIIGILNITPDSFSDGGKFIDAEAAFYGVKNMVSAGADIIDIGAQSTRPNATIISAREEWRRLKPLLEEMKKRNYKAKISIDSFYPKVIKRALEYNIAIINDVSGLASRKMKRLAAKSGKKIIFMHNLGIPADKDKTLDKNIDVVEFLIQWAEAKIIELEKAGIKKEQMIFDPGIGFGKTRQQCVDIIMNAEKFKKLDVKILIGHSEKSFLTLFTNKPAGERGEETRIFSKILAEKNIDYIRVHDVWGNKEVISEI